MKKIFNLKNYKKNSLQFHTSKINRKKINSIQQKYKNFDPHPGSSKYLDYQKWIPKFISYAEKLELIDCDPINILDLGTGPGYFPLVSMNLNHNLRTVDLPDNPIYKELVTLFGIQRREQRINAFEEIKPFDIKFDLITAFAVCFNNHTKNDLWDIKEWEFFINDIKSNLLKSNSRIFIELNREPDGTYLTQSLYDYFISIGASIDTNKIDIKF